MIATLSKSEVRREYATRLELRNAALAQHERRELNIANARLGVAVAGLGIAWAALVARVIGAGWLAVPVVLFAILVVLHERARRACHRALRAADYYRKGLARLDDRWAGSGEQGLRFLNPDHPYAGDLDLFGPGSLFERLCSARTRAGEDRLAAWLLNPAAPEEILARQAAITEIRPRLDLREDLELLGKDVREGIDPDAVSEWGKTPRIFRGSAIPIIAGILAVLGVATLTYWLAFDGDWRLLVGVLCADVALVMATKKRMSAVLAALDRRSHDLVLLSALLARLEHEPLETPRLKVLREALETEGEPASRQIARLARLLNLLDAMKNQLFAPLGALVHWTLLFAVAIDAWRGRSGGAIAGWIAATGEFEAFCAMAAYSFENPADPFPTIEPGEAHFIAQGIGHPLLPESVCVRNDVALGGDLGVYFVSGSNMSGKSTLLRTLGTNTVLSLAGGPVRASQLRLSPLAIGATLRIQDSLQAGRSRFYAEVTRVRQLVDLAAGPIPLFFLLDELFNGTNSHDRQVGAEAIVRGLIDRGAIGLVTTHDLALAEIADRLAPRAVNVHFEDHLENGTMHFDYRMRPGVVQKSNALALMRAVGLDV